MEMKTAWLRAGMCIFLLITQPPFIGVTQAKGDAERGKRLYEKHCLACHGITGEGTGAVGEVIEEQPTSFLSPKSQSKTDQEIFEIIQYGRTIEMHPWEGVLTDQEIWDVIRYIRVLAPLGPGKE